MGNKCPCRICGGTCRVSADGKSGFCKRDKKRWEVKMVTTAELKKMKFGPLRHQELPQPLLEIARWTYEVIGRFLAPSFEQWELGFLRDTHFAQELGIWARVANVYLAFAKATGRGPTTVSQDEGLFFATCWLSGKAQPATPGFMAKVKDEAIQKRLVDLNRPESIAELQSCFAKANVCVPGDFIDKVKDESVRGLLHELNRELANAW